MRGEYSRSPGILSAWRELPPRARRIRVVAVVYPGVFGTTSACAENTPNHATNHGGDRNYLRVRGEYIYLNLLGVVKAELPPRARRIRLSAIAISSGFGTTSACAENTHRQSTACLPTGNYLRVRGEYPKQTAVWPQTQELPPRARRIPAWVANPNRETGTTSACAENTTANTIKPTHRRNYLRVRGEYDSRSLPGGGAPELSPRARRIPHRR